MTYDEYNDICSSLTATSYIVQWGNAYVWKVGGKVFAIGGWEKIGQPAFTFKTSEQDFEFLRTRTGFRPAPYLASRGMKWIQRYDESGNEDEELVYYLRESYRIVSLGLTRKMQKELGLYQEKAGP